MARGGGVFQREAHERNRAGDGRKRVVPLLAEVGGIFQRAGQGFPGRDAGRKGNWTGGKTPDAARIPDDGGGSRRGRTVRAARG